MKDILKKKKILEILMNEKNGKVPQFGNNRSFSNIATSRKFKVNKQKIKIGKITYCVPVSLLKKFWILLYN